MSLPARLRAVERTTSRTGCGLCQERRGETVLVSALQQPEDDREGLPHPCPACGQIPEEIIEIEEVVVEVSEGPHP